MSTIDVSTIIGAHMTNNSIEEEYRRIPVDGSVQLHSGQPPSPLGDWDGLTREATLPP